MHVTCRKPPLSSEDPHAQTEVLERSSTACILGALCSNIPHLSAMPCGVTGTLEGIKCIAPTLSTTTGHPQATLRMKLSLSALSVVALLSFANASPAIRSGSALTQAQAEARLKPNGITASSSGGCTTKSNPTCTSYSGILSGTVDGVITLKNASGASSLVITGGTEVGHASGTYSHTNGYKVDVRHSTTLDNYIKSAFTKIANRGDGYPQWRAASGNIYCDEGSHWDITYY